MSTPVGTPKAVGSALFTKTLSFSFTVPAGADFMTVHLGMEAFTGTITSMVFNTTETLTERIYQTIAAGDRRTALFYLANPTTTTASLDITLSANARQITAIAQAYSGVDPLSGTNGAANGMTLSPAGPSFELNLVTTQPNSLVVDCILTEESTGLTPSGDNTGNEIENISVSQTNLAASFAQIAAALDTADMDWNLVTINGSGSMCAMELLDAGGGGTSLLLLLHARGDD